MIVIVAATRIGKWPLPCCVLQLTGTPVSDVSGSLRRPQGGLRCFFEPCPAPHPHSCAQTRTTTQPRPLLLEATQPFRRVWSRTSQKALEAQDLTPATTAQPLTPLVMTGLLMRKLFVKLRLVKTAAEEDRKAAKEDSKAVADLILAGQKRTHERINELEARLDKMDLMARETNEALETVNMNLKALAETLLEYVPHGPCCCPSCGEACNVDAAEPA